MAPIRSGAVELTHLNYARLVEESFEPWVIQIYEDGSTSSEGFAELWESAVREFDGTVRFGRIDQRGEASLLKRLPFNVIYLPVVMTINGPDQPEIL